MKLPLAVIVASILATSTSSLGYTNFNCSEPSAPYCADRYGEFDDEYEFNSCRSEMEDYRSEVEDYLACLQDEVTRVSREADSSAEEIAQEYEDAVESFNDRAQS